MSTFAELVQRVETSNSNLIMVRDAIVEESIDQTNALIDVMRETTIPKGTQELDRPNATAALFEKEQYQEDRFLQVQQVSFLESIMMNVEGIYKLMSEQDKEKNREMMPDWAKFALAEAAGDALTRGPVIAGAPDSGKKGGKGKFNLKSFFSGALKRGSVLGVAALFANELLMFFFDKTLADMPKILADATRDVWEQFKQTDWSAEWEKIDIMGSLNEGLNSAIRLAFGEGTLEDGFTKAGIGAAIGATIAGPLGAVVLGALGMALGLIKEDDVLKVKDQFIEGINDMLNGLFDMLTLGLFSSGPFDNALDNANAWLSDLLFGTTYTQDRAAYNRSQNPPTLPVSDLGFNGPQAEYDDRANRLNLRMFQARIQSRLDELPKQIDEERNAFQWYQSELQKAQMNAPGALSKDELDSIQVRLLKEENDVTALREEIAAMRVQEQKMLSVVNQDNSVRSAVKMEAIPLSRFETPKRVQ